MFLFADVSRSQGELLCYFFQSRMEDGSVFGSRGKMPPILVDRGEDQSVGRLRAVSDVWVEDELVPDAYLDALTTGVELQIFLAVEDNSGGDVIPRDAISVLGKAALDRIAVNVVDH